VIRLVGANGDFVSRARKLGARNGLIISKEEYK